MVSIPKTCFNSGGSSSGDGSAKTAWTPHSEINGAESAKPRIASAPSATAPVAGAVGVTADRRSSRIASAPSATAPVAGAVGVTDDRRSFRTLTWLREGQCEVSDCRVLITGSGRSGTHFLTEQFQGAGATCLKFDILQTVKAEKGGTMAPGIGPVGSRTGCPAGTAAATAARLCCQRSLIDTTNTCRCREPNAFRTVPMFLGCNRSVRG